MTDISTRDKSEISALLNERVTDQLTDRQQQAYIVVLLRDVRQLLEVAQKTAEHTQLLTRTDG